MDGAKMNGKMLKVKQTNLEFGAHERYVNILGCFKYKPNGNVYVVYTDVDNKYSVVYYGSGHVRQDMMLCMQCRDKNEEEYIKEFIFKVTQKDDLSNFDWLSLDNVSCIEIIGSTNLELKQETLSELMNVMFPKEEVEDNVAVSPNKIEKKVKKKKKKSLIVLLLMVVVIFLIIIFNIWFSGDTATRIDKSITCVKNYENKEVNAMVEETNKCNFNINDELIYVDKKFVFQFNEEDYQNFMLRGNYYKYIPESEDDVEWVIDDDEYLFTVTSKINVGVGYKKPTNYEEVLTYYKNDGYKCTEEIVNE